VRVGIELSGNKGRNTFIWLSLRACKSAEMGSTLLNFVDPEIYLRSRECMVSIMFFQTANDFDSENAVIGEGFDNIALFNFHLLHTWRPMGKTFACVTFPPMISEARTFHIIK
jgi:hypothetical protein